jgi:hypothetical protein
LTRIGFFYFRQGDKVVSVEVSDTLNRCQKLTAAAIANNGLAVLDRECQPSKPQIPQEFDAIFASAEILDAIGIGWGFPSGRATVGQTTDRKNIVTLAPSQGIAAHISVEDIVAGRSLQPIVILTAPEAVLSRIADEGIASFITKQPVTFGVGVRCGG